MTIELVCRESAGLPEDVPGLRASVEDGVVVLEGDLDIAAEGAVGEALSLLPPGQRDVTLDVTGVEFMDCYGLSIILDVERLARRRGGRLLVRGDLRPQVARLLGRTATEDRLTREMTGSADG